MMSLTLVLVQAPSPQDFLPLLEQKESSGFWAEEDNAWVVIFTLKCSQIIQAREMVLPP